MSDLVKHFVSFLSPGTFVSEETVKPIDAWDVEAAVLMAADITERYGAKPYGFRFQTRSRGPDDLDSKITDTSGIYYLGGRIETLAQVKARNNPDDRILIVNMEGNRIDRIVINTNSWKFTAPLRDGDVVLNPDPSHDQ